MRMARTAKMRRHHEPAALRSLGEDRSPRLARQSRIRTARGRQVGLEDLDRAVHRVAAEDRSLLAVIHDKPHLAAGMAWKRSKPEPRVKIVTIVDEIGEAGL